MILHARTTRKFLLLWYTLRSLRSLRNSSNGLGERFVYWSARDVRVHMVLLFDGLSRMPNEPNPFSVVNIPARPGEDKKPYPMVTFDNTFDDLEAWMGSRTIIPVSL